jgi:sigma-B regulation protein RsbU (phosphoserine phosphatase)
MAKDMRTRRERLEAIWGRRSRVGKITLVLLAVICVCTLLLLFGVLPTTDTVLISIAAMAMTPLLLILLFRWFTYRVLWRVRNRLILTYVLMGLAPVVMVVTLAAVATYFLAAEYAVDMGMLQINQGLTRVRDEAGSAAVFGTQGAAQMTRAATFSSGKKGTANSGGTAQASGTGVGGSEDGTPLSLMELKGNAWVPLDGTTAKANTGPLTSGPPPAWLHGGFQGIVEYEGQLYLCAEVSAPREGRTVSVLASRPLTRGELDVMAKGLGRILVSQGFSHLASDAEDETDDEGPNVHVGKNGETKVRVAKDINVNVVTPDDLMKDGGVFQAVSSEPLKDVRHPFLDPPVVFPAELPVKAWATGDEVQAMLAVFSRPSYLYALLFASSVKMGKAIWAILIGIAIFFAMLEVFALAMASSLSWTITRSVAELYRGTRAIDAGHLEHRIPVRRKDQLAALATSFNGMAASVSALLIQQREKERLLNELAIAQEVQTTLFPQSPAFMGSLEVHGTCLPARTVGGDYFDFIFGFGPGAGAEGKTGHVTLALGDISGKGISAALLMSALHSADRAFSAAVNEEGAPVSPALLLKLLNAHLYRSTQSARYATLFLATYDPATRRLTYSNGGHLPPLVISKDGSVQRLEVGGAVVGLLDGLEYEEATVQLEPGDLFVAYTDGLTEPEKHGEDFGEQRLMEFVRAHRDEPLTVLATHTLQVVKAWIGEQEQPDDMTVVLARQG